MKNIKYTFKLVYQITKPDSVMLNISEFHLIQFKTTEICYYRPLHIALAKLLGRVFKLHYIF